MKTKSDEMFSDWWLSDWQRKPLLRDSMARTAFQAGLEAAAKRCREIALSGGVAPLDGYQVAARIQKEFQEDAQ